MTDVTAHLQLVSGNWKCWQNVSLHTVYISEGNFLHALKIPHRHWINTILPDNRFEIELALGNTLLPETSQLRLSALAEHPAFSKAVWLHKSLLGKTFNTDAVLHTKDVPYGNTTWHKGNDYKRNLIPFNALIISPLIQRKGFLWLLRNVGLNPAAKWQWCGDCFIPRLTSTTHCLLSFTFASKAGRTDNFQMKQKLDKLAALQKYTADQAALTQQGH